MKLYDRISKNEGSNFQTNSYFEPTFYTPSSGTIDIKKGDAVVIKGNETAGHAESAEEVILGQASQDVKGNNVPFKVKVRGVVTFNYTGSAPERTGEANAISSSSEAGKVAKDEFGAGKGVAISVDDTNKTVKVIL
ncbi:MAG: hypothetical protein ACOCQD_04925 [archaeon]